MTVILRTMTEAELGARLVGQIEAYAEDLVLSGQATSEDARERSALSHAALLPDGVHSKGHLVFTAEVNGETVGWIWLALPGSSPTRSDLGWIFNVEIDPEFRGRGHGRGILLAAEREMRDRAVPRIGLNVFGHNPVARRLYDSLGYELTACQMVKTLAPQSAARPASTVTSAVTSAGTSAVTLRPMTERELRTWLAEQAGEFAAQLVNAGEATPEEAPDVVRSSVEARLPDGVATPGQLVYRGEADGVTIGWIWAALPGSGGQRRPGTAWIYDVFIDPATRGQGHGRAIIEALERGLAARDIPRLGLNVYGHNIVARRLYDSLGFQVTSAQMVKALRKW